MERVDSALNKLSEAVNLTTNVNKYRRISLEEKVKLYSREDEPKEFIIVRPWNYSDYLLRLKSFVKTMNWFAKPSLISPLECCRYGWVNSGIDTLYCDSCHNAIKHEGKVYMCMYIHLILYNTLVNYTFST